MGANWDPLTKTILSLMKGSGSPEVVFHVPPGNLYAAISCSFQTACESIETFRPLLRERFGLGCAGHIIRTALGPVGGVRDTLDKFIQFAVEQRNGDEGRLLEPDVPWLAHSSIRHLWEGAAD